jgi:hypothetical protein
MPVVRSKYLGAVIALALAGCGPAGRGTFVVRVSGGETARGFAPSLLEDQWAVTFDKYLVSTGDIELSRASGEKLGREERHVVDLTRGSVEAFRWREVPAGRWNVAFSVLPPDDGATLVNVDRTDVDVMRANGWAYLIEGRATKSGVGTFTFRVGLRVSHRYSDCLNGFDGTAGLVVGDGATEVLELSIHVDHLLYDRLGTHRGVKLRFDAWTRGGEQGITLATLHQQDLLDLRGRDGGPLLDASGARVVYDPGPYAVRYLDEFVAQSLTDQAHLNGGGVCTVTPRSP